LAIILFVVHNFKTPICMKKISVFLVLIALSINIGALAQHTKKYASTAGYYWQYLPPGYNDAANATKKYPIIFFLHGQGQIANCPCSTPEQNLAELDDVLTEGLPEQIDNGETMCFTVDGVEQCFIVISPQLKNGNGNTAWNTSIVEKYIKALLINPTLRIDMDRVYLTGLSLGGIGTYDYAMSTRYYASSLAAIAPVAGKGSSLTNVCAIANNKVPVWSFHGSLDTTVPYNSDKNLITALRNCVPPPNPGPRFTVYPGETHTSNGGIWSWVYNTDNTIVDDPLDNGQNPTENLYEWFLKNPRSTANQVPVANAGSDQVIQLPVNSITLNGSGSDADGTIASYQWTKVSGGTATLSGATTATLSLTDLEQGVYVFSLSVTDNGGASSTADLVQVTVNPANVSPVVGAGADVAIQLPVNSIVLTGTASDSDGTIAAYQWTKISGGNATLTDATTATLSLSNLEAGTYVFNLTATDNQGATGSDDVQVIVEPANVAPVVNAGTDVTIDLPANNVVLTGAASDSDGTVVSYSWIKVSGGTASLSGETTATLSVSQLEEGTYVFRLTATDNDGATASDDVTVVVNPAASANWLEMTAINAAGKSIGLYYDAQKNHAVQKLVRAGGNNYLRLYIKTISGVPNWTAFKVELTVSYQTRSLAIGTYATSIGNSWTAVQIPLDDFLHDASRWSTGGLSLVNFKPTSGFGNVVFGVDEIQFTGGATPFVWYGDAYATSGSAACVTENSTIFNITNRYITGGASTSGRIATLHTEEEATREINKGDVVSIYSQTGTLFRKETMKDDYDEKLLFDQRLPAGFYILRIQKPDGKISTLKISRQ
jgi:hypothetical protein